MDHDSVWAPLPAALRPYLALSVESSSAPLESRFGGWWVTAWQSAWPCVQLGRARSVGVVRARPLAGESDPAVTARVIADAAALVTTEASDLDVAARAGTPAIYVPDGAGKPELPAAVRGLGDDRLRVVRSPSAFRRDLPLRWLHDALRELAPGCLTGDSSESAKWRGRLASHLRGRIADLGHGGHKVTPAAVGVDQFAFDPFDWIGDVRDMWFLPDQTFDTVYSAHCLEDLWHPHQALEEWTRILRPNGSLVLYLPLRDHHPNVGAPGANPAHKDDYVPEDVEEFLADLGHMEVVVSERREAEQSFEIVARKQTGRSWFLRRDGRPDPEVSVLLVGDGAGEPEGMADRLLASIETAHASLRGVSHEILCTLRRRPGTDRLAALRDAAARIPECMLREDPTPLGYAARLERLRQTARGRVIVVLAAGAVPLEDALPRLVAAARDAGPALALPRSVNPVGVPLSDQVAAGTCLAIPATEWPSHALAHTAYLTPLLWDVLREQREAAGERVARVADAVVCGGGVGALPIPGLGLAPFEFDGSLAARGVRVLAADGHHGPVGTAREALIVMLRTLGECILALPAIDELGAGAPPPRLTVLTEPRYAWVFERHPAVAEVWTVPEDADGQAFEWVEDQWALAAVRAKPFDALTLLSSRLDNPPYHHAGDTLAGYYAALAGVPHAGDRCPTLRLDPTLRPRMTQVLREVGVRGAYAVLHIVAGWPSKSLPAGLAEQLCAHLAEAHGLAVVVVGGPGEAVVHPMAVNFAGRTSMAETAALIADAAVFVGPDSGPLQMASSFGVRSLALYAGTSLRVAPPLAPGSVALQAPRSCRLPCGLTPCDQACGFDGTSMDVVRARLDEVVRGRVTEREWYGAEPAACIAGPEGPVLVPRPSLVAAADPGGQLAMTEPQPYLVPAREGAAPAHVAVRRELEVTVTEASSASHWRRRLALGRVDDIAGQDAALLRNDVATRLETTLDTIPAASAMATVRAIGVLALDLGLSEPGLRYLCAAMSRAAKATRGVGDRPRPAFRSLAAAMLHTGLAAAGRLDGTWRLADQLLGLYEEEMGERPAVDSALLAALSGPVGEETKTAPRLAALLGDTVGAAERSHDALLTRARLMALLGLTDRAEQLLGTHLAALPAEDPKSSQVVLARGMIRARSRGHAPEAIEDLQRALPGLTETTQIESVHQVLDLLSRMANAAGAEPTGATR
ncbi:MAG: glycosyltransferase family 9 protein [Planctomycetota bacterium]